MRVIICNGENKGIDHNSDTTKESHGARQLGVCVLAIETRVSLNNVIFGVIST